MRARAGRPGRVRQRPREPRPDLGHQSLHAPEPRQGAREPQPELELAGVLRETERGPEVPDLVGEPAEPGDLIRPGELRLGLFGQADVELGVTAPARLELAPLDQLVEPEFLNDLEQLEARLAVGADAAADEAAVDERRRRVQDGVEVELRLRRADRLGRRHPPAAAEDGEPREERACAGASSSS